MNTQDPPGVVRQENDPVRVVPQLPLWQRIVEPSGVPLIAIVGAVFWVHGNIRELAIRVGHLEEDMRSIKGRLNMVGNGGEDTKLLPMPEPSPAPKDEGLRGDQNGDPDPNPSPDPSTILPAPPPLSNVPEHLPRETPNICVQRGTYVIFNCLDVVPGSCLGARSLTPARLAEIKARTGAGDTLLYCDRIPDAPDDEWPVLESRVP
jgi:hypothetical protein